ncbi:MAG: DUF547 domain-containing protein [Gemmatimonas sp.]|jgi:hypothetical protein|uniref:DUF547 domain-containing protein n=2 Tax=Gemmatimonas sp. TaxID=1962908 RepID=UPI00391F60E5|nr:DUF547 domain-containing protein [Gemmatimonadota bacterium]
MRTMQRWGRGLRVLLVAMLAPLGALRAQSVVDHSAYDALLRQHVVNGLVDYDAFARAPSFARYLSTLATADLAPLDDAERLAFWINVFNAYTIQLIVTHGERESIRNINRSLGVLRLKGPWNEPLVKAAGRTLTLDQVFHRILRRDFHEPRIHFAAVPAALGAPPLRHEAYTGARLDAQLEDQTRRVLSDTARTWYRNGVLGLSRGLLAYQEDFGSTQKDLVAFVAPYVTLRPTEPQRDRLTKGRPLVRERSYDWTLNSQRR